jgi:hypothetical protein
MRAIIKLIAVGAVVAMFALDGYVDIEPASLAIGGATLLVVVAFAISRLDRRAPKPRVTLRVLPIAQVTDDDIEGKTVRAPTAAELAYQMHQRYAPAFDQQAALARHLERYGDERYAPEHDHHADFDPHAYQQAQAAAASFDVEPVTETDEYARMFDEQLLMPQRKTRAYEMPPMRFARGSRTGSLQYAAPDDEPSQPSQRQPQEGPAMVRPTARRN